jgi:hypothetical protein
MLKLETREAGRDLIPAAELKQALQAPAIEEGVRLMQRWRHYAE